MRIGQSAAKLQLGILAREVHDLRNRVLKVFRMHAGCADGADFFFVRKDAAAGRFRRIPDIKHRFDLCKRAYAIVMTVSDDHAAIQTEFTRFACRNNLDFRGKKILFFDPVFVLEDLQHIRFDGFLFFIFQGNAADDDVQILTADRLGSFLLQLFCRQMDQQVRNADNGITVVFTDHDIHNRAVFLCNHAV